jgi:hypothetical protein
MSATLLQLLGSCMDERADRQQVDDTVLVLVRVAEAPSPGTPGRLPRLHPCQARPALIFEIIELVRDAAPSSARDVPDELTGAEARVLRYLPAV